MISIDKLKSFLCYRYAPAIVATIVSGLVMVYCLLLFPVGMADNDDFFRIINDQGLYYQTPNKSDHLLNYFTKDYSIRQYKLENTTNFISAQSIAIWVAVKLSALTGGNKVFDIRYLAFIYICIFLVSFYIITKRVMTDTECEIKHIIGNWIKAILFAIIFTDIGYILYFNSFFGESFSYVFFLLTIATIILLIGDTAKNWQMVLFLFSSIMFIGAKQQNAPLGLLFAIFALRLMNLSREKVWRALAIGTAITLVSSSILLYTTISSDITYINQYHALTRGVQAESLDVGKDTEKMGLPRQFALLKNSIFYEGYPVVVTDGDILKENLYSKYSFAKVAVFYITNPVAMIRQLEKSAKLGFESRPDVIGNYQKSDGKPPGAKTNFFSLWNLFKKYCLPHTLGFVIIFLMVIYICNSVSYYFSFANNNIRGQLECESLFLIGAIGISQMFLSFIGAGDADLAKHLFLFDVMFDILFGVLLVNVIDYYFAGKINFLRT